MNYLQWALFGRRGIFMIAGVCLNVTMSLHADEPHVLSGHTDAAYGLAYSPDGELLASGSYDNSLTLWRVDDGSKTGSLSGHRDQVFRIAFSPDGERIASASGDGSVMIWDVASRQRLATMTGHGDPIIDVQFSSDGKRLVSVGSHVQMWCDGEQVWSTPHSELYFSVAWSPDQKVIACGTRNQIHLLDSGNGERLATLDQDAGVVYQMAYSRDGAVLATASSDGALSLWETASRRQLRSVSGDQFSLFAVQFSADGRTLVTGGRERVIRLWRFPGLELVEERYGPEETILSSVFSPRDSRIACGSYEGKIYLWEP